LVNIKNVITKDEFKEIASTDKRHLAILEFVNQQLYQLRKEKAL